jgi:hypothetical protein
METNRNTAHTTTQKIRRWRSDFPSTPRNLGTEAGSNSYESPGAERNNGNRKGHLTTKWFMSLRSPTEHEKDKGCSPPSLSSPVPGEDEGGLQGSSDFDDSTDRISKERGHEEPSAAEPQPNKRRVNHEGHEAHEGYAVGTGFKPSPTIKYLCVLQFRALRDLRGENEFFYEIAT